jgi:hypothetical protein
MAISLPPGWSLLFTDPRTEMNKLRVRVRVRVTLRLAVYRQSVCLGDNPLRLTTSIFFQLSTCGYTPYVTRSMRGLVCRLQLLLVIANAVILRSESRGTHDHILRSQIGDCPNLEGQAPVFISPRKRVAQLYPQALGSLFVALLTLFVANNISARTE